MYSIVKTAIIQGMESVPVQVEADVSPGLPVFEMVGVLSAEVREARERVRTALRNSGYQLPPKRITINLFPAMIRKSGTGFDLPIAIAILAAMEVIPQKNLEHTLILGEVGLDGSVRCVRGILPHVLQAKLSGIRRCLVPKDNLWEAEMVSEMLTGGVDTLLSAVSCLNNPKAGFHITRGYYSDSTEYNIEEIQSTTENDFSEICGQEGLKRACEIAVAGMHHFLMIGPPGSGKTMLAKRIPSILPPLDEEEIMEIAQIYSVTGLLDCRSGIAVQRPFRSPHHTATAGGLAGGGGCPRPGEITLAHKGVLFLDELPEFSSHALEILRQPMEEKQVRLVRAGGTYTYPADAVVVAAMNPCKCGYYPDRNKCRCSRTSIMHYLDRISQPLLDRMDICVDAPRIQFEELNGNRKGVETSIQIQARIIKAHKIQLQRFAGTGMKFNSQIPSSALEQYCLLVPEQRIFMKQVYQKLNLSARSYHKLLKTARTIADLDGCELISTDHLKEAVCYRMPDRRYWNAEGREL